jgi:hypothetical protein
MRTLLLTLMACTCRPTVENPDSESGWRPGDTERDTAPDTDIDTGAGPLGLSAAFDSGSIGAWTIEGDSITATLATHELVNTGVEYAYWLHVELSGAEDRTVDFALEGIRHAAFFGDHPDESQLVTSCDGERWERITEHSYDEREGGTYRFTHRFDCDRPRVATFFPSSWEDLDRWTRIKGKHPHASLSILGQSAQGRDLYELKITNPELPDAGKRTVFVLGRQHAAETAGSHQLTGMVDFLLSGEPEAQPLLDRAVWRVVPMLNPDGVYLGLNRGTSQLRDPNADWANDSSIEVVTVRDRVRSLAEETGLDMVLDWHNQVNDERWHDFVYAPTGNRFFPVLSEWTAFDEQEASGASECTAADCSFRGWSMSQVLFDPMFVLEPSPHQAHWTLDRLRAQGALTARAIGDYFELD